MASYNPVQTRLLARAPLPKFCITYECSLTVRNGSHPVTIRGQYTLAAIDGEAAQARFHALFNIRFQLVHATTLTIQKVDQL